MSVYYDSHQKCDGDYLDKPELIIPYPKEPLSLDGLLDHVVYELGDDIYSEEISEFIQTQASECAAEVDTVSHEDNEVILHILDGVYVGDGHYWHKQVALILDVSFSTEGIHLHVGARKEVDENREDGYFDTEVEI